MRPHTTQGNKKRDKLGDRKEQKLGDRQGRQDLGKADIHSNRGKHAGLELETMCDKGKRTQHPTQANMRETRGDNGSQGETGPWRHTCGRQRGTIPSGRHTPSNKGRKKGYTGGQSKTLE